MPEIIISDAQVSKLTDWISTEGGIKLEPHELQKRGISEGVEGWNVKGRFVGICRMDDLEYYAGVSPAGPKRAGESRLTPITSLIYTDSCLYPRRLSEFVRLGIVDGGSIVLQSR